MEILLTSIIAFVSTNIDDLFILTLFFGNRKIKHSEIIGGQFLGIIALVIVSLAGSLLGLLIDPAYIGLLGFIPIYLGIKGVYHLLRPEQSNANENQINSDKNHVLSVAGVTFSNGGDNIGIYTPLFATLSWADKTVMIAVFLVMTMVWCLTARYFTKHPLVAAAIDKYGHLVTPFVLILLGIYILYESNSIELVLRMIG